MKIKLIVTSPKKLRMDGNTSRKLPNEHKTVQQLSFTATVKR